MLLKAVDNKVEPINEDVNNHLPSVPRVEHELTCKAASNLWYREARSNHLSNHRRQDDGDAGAVKRAGADDERNVPRKFNDSKVDVDSFAQTPHGCAGAVAAFGVDFRG